MSAKRSRSMPFTMQSATCSGWIALNVAEMARVSSGLNSFSHAS